MGTHDRSRCFRVIIAVGLLSLSTMVAILLGEVLVRVVVNPGGLLHATLIDDPILGHRIKPYTTGHDALGFRNPRVPERVDIVAIGDSQTYGVSATRDGSWPHQVGILLGQSVYNMGLGGYGPLHYLYLAEHEAKTLQPRMLIVGFYIGNDLMDAYGAAYHRSYWSDWRMRDWVDSGQPEYHKAWDSQPTKRLAFVRNWLSRNSVVYSLLRITVFSRIAQWEKNRMASRVPPDTQMIWMDPSDRSVRTIFTPKPRLAALDPKLPTVKEGLRITKKAFTALKHGTSANAITLLIVLIPTKERAYCRYLKESGGSMPSTFLRLCDAEEEVQADLKHFLETSKIAYVDVTGVLEEKIYQHVQLYPKVADGHPLASGYRAIAQAIYEVARE